MAARVFRNLTDKEPMVAVSIVIGTGSIAFAWIAPRVRHAMGLDVEQYYGLEDPSGGPKDLISPVRKVIFTKDNIGAVPEGTER